MSNPRMEPFMSYSMRSRSIKATKITIVCICSPMGSCMLNHHRQLFLHTGETFVTRKVSRSVAQIHLGHRESVSCTILCITILMWWSDILVCLFQQFKLGNLDAKRDWGHAKDYVEVTRVKMPITFDHAPYMYVCVCKVVYWYMTACMSLSLSLYLSLRVCACVCVCARARAHALLCVYVCVFVREMWDYNGKGCNCQIWLKLKANVCMHYFTLAHFTPEGSGLF